jgi:hypothetical protein
MIIFKRLFGWAVSVFNDILEGNLTDSEKDSLFWLFVTLWGLVMVTFFILHESTGAVFEL